MVTTAVAVGLASSGLPAVAFPDLGGDVRDEGLRFAPGVSAPLGAPDLEVPAGDFSDPPSADATPLGAPEGAASDVPGSQRAKQPGGRFDPATAELIGRSRNALIYEGSEPGSKVALVASGPINWKGRDGKWKALDRRLRRGADGRYRNGSGPLEVEFAPVTGPGDLVVTRGDGWSAGFRLEGAADGKVGISDGSTMRYDAVRDGVALEYHMGNESLKEFIVLDRRPAEGEAVRYRFPLNLSGVEPVAAADGSIALVDRSGAQVATIPTGTMSDAAGATVPVPLSLVSDGAASAIEVAPGSWLMDEARVFPVRIDPWIFLGQVVSENEDAYNVQSDESGRAGQQ